MAIPIESGVKRWLRCVHAQTCGLSDPMEGYNNGYGCSKPEVVQDDDSLDVIKIEWTGKTIFNLHPPGDLSDWGVQVTLDRWCKNCLFLNLESLKFF